MTISIHVRYRLLIVSVIAALSVVLSGCQGSAAPVGSSSPPSTTSPTSAASTPSPTQTPTAPPAYKPADASGKAQNVPVPEKPSLADENSKEGLEAFTKYWFDLLSYAYETGDVTLYSSLFTPECTFCQGLGDGVEESYVQGRWLVGGRMRAEQVDAKFDKSGVDEKVLLQLIHEPIDYFNADGSVGRGSSDGSNVASVAVASYVAGQWQIVDLGLVR